MLHSIWSHWMIIVKYIWIIGSAVIFLKYLEWNVSPMDPGPVLYHWASSPAPPSPPSLASWCHCVEYYWSLWLTKIITMLLIPASFLLLWFKSILTKRSWGKKEFIWISVLMGESRWQSCEVINHIHDQGQREKRHMHAGYSVNFLSF